MTDHDHPSAAAGTTAGARLSEDELWLDQVRGDVEAGFPFGSKKMARVLAWLDAVRLERDAARQWSARWKEAATSKRVEHESLHDHLCLVVSTWEQALAASEARVAQLVASIKVHRFDDGTWVVGVPVDRWQDVAALVDARQPTAQPGASPAASLGPEGSEPCHVCGAPVAVICEDCLTRGGMS